MSSASCIDYLDVCCFKLCEELGGWEENVGLLDVLTCTNACVKSAADPEFRGCDRFKKMKTAT